MVIIVNHLVWDAVNTRHIYLKHGVVPEEVEEVCRSNPLVIRARQGRLGVMGATEDSRILKVILRPKGKNAYYPVTAFEPQADDLALYKRLKGGEPK